MQNGQKVNPQVCGETLAAVTPLSPSGVLVLLVPGEVLVVLTLKTWDSWHQLKTG